MTRILLVEDDPVSRDLLASLIEVGGHTVDTADDGFNALRLTQENAYDLVLIDYHLPEMDGYALARLMRSLSEKSERAPKMVAVTADRFGLATRRGVDSIFDHMLAKPIEPETLFAFLEECLAPPAAETSEIDAFLAGPTSDDAQSAAQVLWRVRGISTLPCAAVFPAPDAKEHASLAYCFKLVDAEAADCIVLLRREGLAAVEALRESGRSFLQPLLTLDETLDAAADAVFKVGDSESWSTAAATITSFAARRDELVAGIAQCSEVELRLAAYLYVSGRTLLLQRDALGRTIVPYSGGFAPQTVTEAIRRLAARGYLKATPGQTARDGMRELQVALTSQGLTAVAGATAALSSSA